MAEAARAIMPLDVAAHLLPFVLADPRGNAAIGEDLHVAIGKQYIDEHAVVLRSVPDPEMTEDLRCPPAGRHLSP